MRYIDLKKIDEKSNEMRSWLPKATKKNLDFNALNTHDQRKEYLKNNNIC